MSAILIVIYIVFISLGLPDSVFGVAWPLAHLDFGVKESLASVYSIVIGICSGGASFVAGRVLRKFGTARVTFVSILLTIFGMVGMSYAPNLFVMMVFAVVLAYGAGAIDTGLNNYVSLHYEARHMSWLHCFWGIGVTVSPLIMSRFLTEQVSSWRGGYRVVALIQLFIGLVVLFFLKKWISLDRSKKQQEEEKAEGEKLKISAFKGLVPSIASLGFYCAMEFTIGTWGATYLINTLAISPDSAARWVAFYYGGIMLGRLVSGFVSMKATDKAMIRAGLIIAFCGFVVLALPLGTASCFGLLLVGFGFGPVFPSVLHSVPERFGSTFSADLTGYHMGGAYAMGFAFQLGFGYLATATTFRITPFVMMIPGVLAFVSNELAVRKRTLHF